MADKGTRALLFAFLVVTVLCALALGVFFTGSRLSELESRIARFRSPIAALESRTVSGPGLEERKAALLSELEGRRNVFYRSGELDTYRFGLLVRKTFGEYDIGISTYRTVSLDGKTIVEFVCSGSAAGFMRFFRHVSLQEKKWSVVSLELSRKDGGNLNCVMRIGYEEDPAGAE